MRLYLACAVIAEESVLIALRGYAWLRRAAAAARRDALAGLEEVAARR